MFSKLALLTLLSAALLPAGSVCASGPAWPPAPAETRVEFVSQIDLGELKPQSGFFGRLGRVLGGGDPEEKLRQPFDILATEDRIYLTCQDRQGLVVINPADKNYKLYFCEDQPLVKPLALAMLDGQVLLSDSGNGTIYRFDGKQLKPWITAGLVRPTGLTPSADGQFLMVVDTGDHRLKLFDKKGILIRILGQRGDNPTDLNFPTFASQSQGQFLVNDTLNYQIKRYGNQGEFLGSFGREGDVPGSFARPKGLDADSDGNIWVVDGLFDNIQVFDPTGQLLLVIGGPGQAEGQFWSPVGIDFFGDEVFVADTFNNRIQILKYLGGDS